MKTNNSNTAPTQEQIEARKRAEAFFADLLAPKSKEAKSKTKPKTTPSATPERRVDPSKSETFIAVERQYHIVTQECKTCGTQQRYAATKIVRFKASRRKDDLHIEIPCSLHPALDIPAKVMNSYETTDFCPECLDLVLRIDHTFDSLPQPSVQLSLFK